MRFWSNFQHIIDDRNGNVATIFAALLIPMTFSIGAAVDYSRYQTSIQQLTAAQNSAMHAASRKIRTANLANIKALRSELEIEFDKFMEANFDGQKYNTEYQYEISFDKQKNSIILDLTARQNTTFLAMVGKTHFDYHQRVETPLAPESYLGNIAECINATGVMRDVRDSIRTLEKLTGKRLRLPVRKKFHANSLEAELAKRLKFKRRTKNARALCKVAFPKKRNK